MKTKLRIASLLLVALTLLSSCGKADDTNKPAETTGGTNTPAETTSAEETRIPLGLASDLNYDGATVRVLTPHADRENGHTDSFVIETNGDFVNDALHKRDRAVEDLLGVEFNLIANNKTVTPDSLTKTVLGDDDLYDFMHLEGSSFFANRPTFETILLDVSESANLDISAPWWHEESIRELSFNGTSIKMLIGDISLSSIGGASVIFYNKNMFNNLYQDPEKPYEDVISGTWTIDKYTEYAKGAYNDVDGGGIKDENDVYGAAVNQWMIQSFYNGFSDTRFYTRDEDGLVRLNCDLDRATTMAQKLYDLIWESDSVYFSKDSQYHASAHKYFAEDKTLFLTHFLNTVEKAEMRGMKSDYGILPFFKLDETQKEYRTDSNPSGTQWICLPKTCRNVDMSTAVIEALCYTSYYDVTPLYYEVALKSKYVRDDMSSQVIDIVRDSIVTDYLIGIYRSSIGQHFANCVHQQKTDFASSWDKSLKKYNTEMEKAYEKLIADLDN